MQRINLEVPDNIKELLREIQQHSPNYDVYLGGGSLRDWYTGEEPKDLDIFFVPVCTGVEDELYIPKSFYVNYRKDTKSVAASSDMAERGVSRLIGLFNGNLSPSEVQYIVYKEPMTTKELVHDMDINICRVMYSVDADQVFCSDSFIDGHQHKYISCEVDYDKIRTYHRFERMEAKFPDYDVVGKPTLEIIEEENLEEIKENNLTVLALIEEKAVRSAGSIDVGE